MFSSRTSDERQTPDDAKQSSDWTCTDNAFLAPSAIRLRCTAWSRAHTSLEGPPKGCPVNDLRVASGMVDHGGARCLSAESEVVHPGDAEHGLVDTVALEAAVAEDLPGLSVRGGR